MVCHDPKELLDELSRLEGLRSGGGRTSRRRHKRFIVRGQAELFDTDSSSSGEPPVAIMLRDMGRGGLGFVADSSVDLGSVRRLRLTQRGYCIGETSLVVRHCSQVKDQIYLVGSQICLSNGLMFLAGVDPSMVEEGGTDADAIASAAFLPPAEVQ